MSKRAKTSSKNLKPGKDYYIENGYWVFTEEFLKKRGYCCESLCRHCPYGFANRVKSNKNKKL